MNIPKIRFSEFKDEWQEVNLKDIFNYFSTNSLSRDQLSSNGIIKNIHYGDIHRKFSTIVNVDTDIDTYIKDLNYKNRYELCKDYDLIFADASEDYDGIGKVIEITNISSDTIAGLHTILARDSANIFAPKFKGYYFNSPIIHNQIRILANGFKVYGISKETINKLCTKIPSKIEQQKIATTLELLDKKIELQSKKIENLKLFKKGLIKRFFSEDNLKQITINDIGTIITGTTPSKANSSYWENGNIVWITPSDIGEERDINNSIYKITENGLKHGRFIPKNSILVTCIASIGKNAVLKSDGSCNQQINAIIPDKNYNFNYIYYLMNSISNYMQSIAGTSATSIINKEEFSKINVKVHNFEKQNYIDKVLSYFEDKIIKEKIKLEQLSKLKKGLMQNMFV